MTTEETKTLVELDREIEEHAQDVPQASLRRYGELLAKHISESSSAPVLKIRPRNCGPRPDHQWVA